MKRFFCISLLFFCVLLCICAQAQSEKLTVAMDIAKGERIILNPYTASDSASVVILLNLYEGLFSYDPQTGKPLNAIAQSYSVSEDGLIWTFTLRPAYFSDHSRITSSTFAKSWNYLLQGPLASNLDFVNQIDTPDSQTLIVRLKHPVSYLPSLLCQPCLAAINPEKSNIFSGAYKVVQQTDNLIELKANPYYHEIVGCSEVEILVGQDSDFSQAFQDGEIQWSMAHIDNALDYMVVSPLYGTTFLYFSADSGLYSDPYMQRALARLIPVEYIRQIQSAVLPSSSLVPQSGAQAVYDGTFADDISTALKHAAIESAEDFPLLQIAFYRGDATTLSGELIQEIWSSTLHNTVSLDTVPGTVYTSDPAANTYDFCIITWIADYYDPAAFLSLFRSDASYNLARYSNAQYDSLLDLADVSQDRERYLLEAEQLLLDYGTVIPVSTAVSTNFVRDDLIEGWYANLLDIHPLKSIRLR